MKYIKFNTLKLFRYYDESAYCCPKCGTHSRDCSSNGYWGYICNECGTEFETPDT